MVNNSNFLIDSITGLDNIRLTASNLGPQAALTSWIGHSITQINIVHAFGFGAVVGVISALTQPIFQMLTDCLFTDPRTSVNASVALSTLAGGAGAYGASIGIASLGIVAAPITLSGAALITGTLLITQMACMCFYQARSAYYRNVNA